MLGLSRNDGVTIFISTHFMNEAERCDRISLMHAGRILATGKPEELVERSGQKTLEDTFIAYLEQAVAATNQPAEISAAAPGQSRIEGRRHQLSAFSLQRLMSYAYRELLELRRDPIRLALALGGTLPPMPASAWLARSSFRRLA